MVVPSERTGSLIPGNVAVVVNVKHVNNAGSVDFYGNAGRRLRFHGAGLARNVTLIDYVCIFRVRSFYYVDAIKVEKNALGIL